MVTLSAGKIPNDLRSLPQPVEELFVQGDLTSLLKRPRLAVVGSRNISPYGRAITMQLVQELTRQGIVIVSGLALGVDAMAHSACLEAGGQTIAVLPSGLDAIYPAGHRHLAQSILEQGGALVSEYPAGSTPYKVNFIARNRIIAGLAEGVLITEAAEHSGALHTAEFAEQAHKHVMAVPGNITSATSAGTNKLIRDGGLIVTDAEDVLMIMGWHNRKPEPVTLLGATPEEQTILELLHAGHHDGNDLLGRSGMAASTFNQTISLLEITGKIRSLGANQWHIR